jgi:L-serine dehydratase
MFISVFDIFKLGIGPSSSHTMGPMVAAGRFLDALRDHDAADVVGLKVRLHGSLAFTGHGHGTDRAVLLGLLGLTPETLEPDQAEALVAAAERTGQIAPAGLPPLAFALADDLAFDYGPPLPGHANGLVFEALGADGGVRLARTYYSIGGGFVVEAAEWQALQTAARDAGGETGAAYPFASAAEMLAMGEAAGLSIVAMKRANELARRTPAELDAGLDRIWQVMHACMERGLASDGQCRAA